MKSVGIRKKKDRKFLLGAVLDKTLNKINFRQKEQTREAHHITINNKTSIT